MPEKVGDQDLGLLGRTGVESSVRGLEHHRRCFAAEWHGRTALLQSVQNAAVKGFPPKKKRFPPEGVSSDTLGLQMVLSSGIYVPRVPVASRQQVLQPPSQSLSQLLGALEHEPWKHKPLENRRRRPMSAGPLLLGNQSKASGNAPASPVQQPRMRTKSAMPAYMKPVLTACEKELKLLFSTRDPPEQFQALFVTMLILVSPSTVQDEHFTWSTFRKWVRTLDGAAGFLQNVRNFVSSQVAGFCAERAIRHLVDHRLYPDKFVIGEEFYDRKFCARFARSFCQWLWDTASSVMRRDQDCGNNEEQPSEARRPRSALLPAGLRT